MVRADHAAIQKAIDDTIANTGFSASLPPLSEDTWRKILVGQSVETASENDRLEFLGDALMYATIGRQLYAQCPQGTPHLYTVLRAALHSNATFSKLAEKLDVLAVSSVVLNALTVQTFGDGSSAQPKQRPQVKRTADLFETVIGAYYLECGFESLMAWIGDIYSPLIAAARKSFNASTLRKKRQEAGTVSAIVKKVKKSAKRSTRSIRILTSRKDNIHFLQPLPVSRAEDMRSRTHSMMFPTVQTSSAAGTEQLLAPPSATHAPIQSTVHVPSHSLPQVSANQGILVRNPDIQDLKTRAKTSLRPLIPRKRVPVTHMRSTRSKQPPIFIDLTLDDSPNPSRNSTPQSRLKDEAAQQSPSASSSNDEQDDLDELEEMLIPGDDVSQDQILKVFL